jgi:ADP-ribose pyrophosphatase
MKLSSNLPQAPVLVGERTIDDRYKRFGKLVVERDFRMPTGDVITMLCVDGGGLHPFITFAVTDAGTVILVKQFRYAMNNWVYELIGGCPKPGQSWEECIKSELLEEVGAVAKEIKIIGKPMPLNPAILDVQVTAVLATGCRIIRPQELDSTEVMTIEEVPISEFRDSIRSGRYCDAKTVATGYLALDHLGLLR